MTGGACFSATGLFVFLLAVYYFIYHLNQLAVRSQLEPRRQELLALLTGLGDESTGELAAMPSARSVASPGRLRPRPILAVSCVVALVVMTLASGIFGSSYDQPPKVDGPIGAALGRLISETRKQKHLVGLAAMVVVDGQVEAAAADGERKHGSGVPVEVSDRWHLGGITKSITATMIARLVESGQMQWSDTVGKIFPEASVHEDWKPVTLKQLLTDTAGAPRDFPKEIFYRRPALGPRRTQARREAVLQVISDQPAYPPGKKNEYSNVGYTIVGAMAEKVTGASWEDLVQREVFEPLGLKGAGFGPPKSPAETLPQPLGHRTFLGWKTAADAEADNSPIMGPSGSVHMTLRDLTTYATEHLRDERGEGKLLSAESYQFLHARPRPLRLRLDQAGSKPGDSLLGVLAQRFEHVVVRAGGVHPREEHGRRRHLERRRRCQRRSRGVGGCERQPDAVRRHCRWPTPRA